ncbi:hypothetical protein ACFQ2T_08030 [Methylophilus flavus]|uniref:Uncharacterized protein n=1 Tax=Methylophilus flavus TaxID=640084 RepID=A0ABW3PJP5_9PROT
MFSVLRRTSTKVFFDDVELHDSVELESFIPWYLCQVAEYDEINQCYVSTMQLVSSIDSLISICQYYEVEHIYLVSPAYLNKSDGWRIDLLRAIHTCDIAENEIESTLMKFVLKNGQGLVYGHNQDLIGCDKAPFDLLIDFDQIKK